MELTLKLKIPPLEPSIIYDDKIFLIGSCFTEHISKRLHAHKFDVMSNPNGILFNPQSVADSLSGYVKNRRYNKEDLFYLNELWNSWDHHTRFSDISADIALKNMNDEAEMAATFIKDCTKIIITLGSAFQYYLIEGNKPVANNHRAPSQWFEKRLLEIEDIIRHLNEMQQKLWAINPGCQIIYTISPVRHIRDGVVENNRSKARLIEAVQKLCEGNKQRCYYFPAYELVIDILRDYRYYDIDFVHPNYLATEYVWEEFVNACVDSKTREVMTLVEEIMMAKNHRPRFSNTQAHQKFMENYALKVKDFMQTYPNIDMAEDLLYFSSKDEPLK